MDKEERKEARNEIKHGKGTFSPVWIGGIIWFFAMVYATFVDMRIGLIVFALGISELLIIMGLVNLMKYIATALELKIETRGA